MSEPITIILITAGSSRERTEYALRTVASVRENLRYPDIKWFVADDGSPEEHLSRVVGSIPSDDLLGVWSERDSYGRSCNEGIRAGRERGRLLFFLEDDWELTRPFDIWPYAALLMEKETVGMVRMGYLNEGIWGRTMGHRGQLYWELSDESPYIFTGHPALRHTRFHDHAGPYIERLQPGETELAMAWSYKSSPEGKPSIVWPCLLEMNGPFAHIGAVQSYTWNGGERL